MRILVYYKYVKDGAANVAPPTPQLPGFTSIYQALGYRFRPVNPRVVGMDGGCTACHVGQGVFDHHTRIKENELPYV